jgi:Toc86/159 family protein import component
MENGVERVVVEEKTNVGNEGFGDKVEEERVVVGSDESKDLEDEVFEEAIESHEQLQEEEGEEEGMKVVSDGGVFESVGDLISAVVDESSNLGNETEKLEEALFIPAESGNPDELGGVVGEEKVEDLVGEDSVDKIDEGGTAKEARGSESSGGEVAEIVGNGVTEDLKAEGEGEVDSKQGIKLDEEILLKDDEREELKEDELSTEYQGTSGNSGMSQNLIKMDAEHLDEKSGELKGNGESAKEDGNNELIGGEEVSEITVNGETQVLRSEAEVNSNREIESSKELNNDGDYAQEVGNNETSGDAGVSEIAGNLGTEALKGENEADPNREILLSKEILPEDGEREELKEDNAEVSEIAGNIGTEALKGEYEAIPDREIELSKEILSEDGEREELKEGNAEVSEIAGNIGTEALKGECEADPNRESELSKEILSEDGEREELKEGNAEVSEIAGNIGTEALKGECEADPNREIELSKEILSEDGEREELKEDKLGSEYQEANESINLSGDLQGDKSEGLDDNLEKPDIKHDFEKNVDFDSAIVGLDAGIGVHKSEHFRDISTVVDTENHDDSNGKLKDVSAVIASEQNGETHELKAASSVPQTVVEEVKLVPGVLASSSLEKSVTERNEEIQARASNVRAEDNKGSEVHHAANNTNGVSKSTTVTEEPKEKADKGQEDKQTTPANIERKIKHVPKIASSSAKSSSAAPAPSRPAGLGRAAPLLEPAPRAVQQPRANGAVSHTQSQQIEDPTNGESEEFDETREKLQMIRVKFLRLAHRLGQTPHNVVVAQVLYRLGLAEQLRGRSGGRVAGFSFDRASAMAEQLEAAGQEPLDFSCTIMVLGKTGVGKSATINSIFDEVKFGTDAFQLGTKKVQDVVGTVQGIKVRVIDTPGLLPSWSDQRQNEKILHSVKRFIKKTPPDIVLYLDRLDMQSRDFGDMPLLRTITDIFGPSIWFNAIVVLTHAASAPPDGPNGTASSYDMFVTQRSHAVQQAIRQAAGDMRLMNPVSLVENHSACRTNRAGQRVLPNGQVWKPHLLLLSFASKILAEANALLKLQDSTPAKPFATRSRAPPLPFLLSSLLQSRPQVKLPEEQYGGEDGLDDDLDDSSDSEDESEYDELPPFKSLTRAQISKLTKAQKKAYFDELEYREKLFMKKQLKEEKRRQKMMKKMAAAAKDLPSEYIENAEEEGGGAASVPVPMPDLALPASFDSDNPTHRYRYLDTSNQWLVRPVLETHGWDHDVGYEGINVERLFVVKDKIPLSFSGQVTKDKKDASVQMELASSVKHGEGKATSLGFDMQTVGKDLAYTLRSETRFSNFRKNKATAGLSVSLLGDVLSTGVKVEDKLIAGKRFQMVMSGGAMSGRGDVAYGGSLEIQLRDKDYPLGRSLSTLGLSVMDWHGDLAIGCNLQSQIPIGRSTNLIGRANLNNRGAGQISIRLNSSEQLQLALIGLIPLLKKLIEYPQQLQLGQ